MHAVQCLCPWGCLSPLSELALQPLVAGLLLAAQIHLLSSRPLCSQLLCLQDTDPDSICLTLLLQQLQLLLAFLQLQAGGQTLRRALGSMTPEAVLNEPRCV